MADRPQIDGYSDLQRIAQGGFGVVYRARQDRFGRVVALKVLQVDGLDATDQLRFERECLAMGSLSWHPNVVALHDSGVTADGHPYLVMEFLEAGSLGDRLRDGPLSWPLAVRAGVEVAGALGAAHAAGTLHRDLKPENLLVGPFGEAKLGDFGIAAVEGAARTAGGAISFTVAHVAPEVLAGAEPDERSDVYGLASTLHTLIAGTSPFDTSGSLGDVVTRVVHQPPPRLAHAPSDLADLILRALDKDPGRRPESAAAIGRALQAVQADRGHPVTALRLRPGATEQGPEPAATTPPTAAPPPPPPPPRPPQPTPPPASPARPSPPPAPATRSGSRPPSAVVAVAALAAVVALAVIATGAWFLLARDDGGSPPGTATSDPTTTSPTSEATTTGPAPAVVATVGVGGGPEQVAVTDEAVWVVNSLDNTVSRIDPATEQVVEVIAVGISPFAIAATEDAVWVANSESGNLSRIDPATNDVVATVALRSFPGGLVATDDEVWVTGFDDGTVSRIDPARNRVVGIARVGPSPNGIALTRDAVWVASPVASTVTRIDRATDEVLATIELPGGTQPNGVAATDDAVWVTGFGNDTVTRIDPATDRVVATVEAGNQVNGVAATDAAVWVANQADGTVTRIDPATDTVTATVDVGDSPNGIAATEADVWVTNFNPATATRIDPDGG